METKSRYAVISELEQKKRDLIRERDESDSAVVVKEKNVLILTRQKEDIAKQKTDFELQQNNSVDDLKRAAVDFDFKIKNTEEQINREIEDAEKDLDFFKSTIEKRKKTVEELIEGIEESLSRFGKLADSKK